MSIDSDAKLLKLCWIKLISEIYFNTVTLTAISKMPDYNEFNFMIELNLDKTVTTISVYPKTTIFEWAASLGGLEKFLEIALILRLYHGWLYRKSAAKLLNKEDKRSCW